MSDLEEQLRAKLERGDITNADADAVREFEAFLAEVGPRPGQPGHDPARRMRAIARLDPDAVATEFLRLKAQRDAAQLDHEKFLEELDVAFELEEGEEAKYSNPEGDYESILLDVAKGIRRERDATLAKVNRAKELGVSSAIGEHARGRYDEERKWLDLLAILDAPTKAGGDDE